MPESALLDLTYPRTVVLVERDRPFVFRCRRITDADWSAYFSGIRITSEQNGRERTNVVDVATPRLALAEAVLESVGGYKVAGGGDIESLPEWRKRIPLAHRLKLGEVLADARVSASRDELEIAPEGEVVSLDCTWSATGAVMQRFEGLKHVLQSPSEEQHRRFQRAASRSIVVGGSRGGKTVYPGASALLATLYDELVISVEGYAISNREDLFPLPLESREEIVREMDMLHKVMAAQELFQPQSAVELAVDEQE